MHLLAREEAGLRCLLQVALAGAASGPVPIAQIAAEQELSSVYAAKLMRQLRLAGLVASTRGASGGYALSRPADRISVWDALRALDDEFLPAASCTCEPADRVDCRRTTRCAVASLWRRLGAQIRDELSRVTLAELCDGALERPDRVELPVVATDAAVRPSRGDAGATEAGASPPSGPDREAGASPPPGPDLRPPVPTPDATLRSSAPRPGTRSPQGSVAGTQTRSPRW